MVREADRLDPYSCFRLITLIFSSNEKAGCIFELVMLVYKL